jgi:hypothetical protein
LWKLLDKLNAQEVAMTAPAARGPSNKFDVEIARLRANARVKVAIISTAGFIALGVVGTGSPALHGWWIAI